MPRIFVPKDFKPLHFKPTQISDTDNFTPVQLQPLTITSLKTSHPWNLSLSLCNPMATSLRGNVNTLKVLSLKLQHLQL